MSGPALLERLEAIIDTSGVAPRIEAALPIGGRPRQLSCRTLLLGVLFALADARPAHLTRVHHALVGLDATDRRRLGVDVDWRHGPHTLTYRQVERTFGLVVDALTEDQPDGTPSETLTDVIDALVEASIPAAWKQASTALAIDWTDHETFANPPLSPGGPCADPEASWGHRRGNHPGQRDELFFGYYLSAATMVADEHRLAVPELVRRITLTTCALDPVTAFVPAIERLAASGVTIGDVLADSGYAHRRPTNWALPLRRLGAQLVVDLHPHDRGPQGTHAGTIISNGNLYCPTTPKALLELGPLARNTTDQETDRHDTRTAELAHYKLGRITTHDTDGYHRVACPAVQAKLRCPLRPESMTLPFDRPEILAPPEHPPPCCTQQTLTIPPTVAAKTAQKHDYPSKTHRQSYTRRSAAERSFSTIKDPATTNLTRGWCRLMGRSALTLFIACAFMTRNLRVLDAFQTRTAEEQQRVAAGTPAKTRRRRRRTLTDLTAHSAA